MGYFNIFYKITRIIDMLTRKRNRRAIMVILIIIAVIFILHNKGYCAQEDSTYTTDTDIYILEYYQKLVNQLVVAYNQQYENKKADWNDLFSRVASGEYFYIRYSGGDEQSEFVNILMYSASNSVSLVDTNYTYNQYLRIPLTRL